MWSPISYARHATQALFGTERAYISFPSIGLSYCRIPKNANSSVKLALRKALQLPNTGIAAAKDQYWRKLPDDRVRFETARAAAHARYEICFAVIRDPATRIASCYRNKIVVPREGKLMTSLSRLGFRKEMSLSDFVAQACALPDCITGVHLRSQAHYVLHQRELVPNRLLLFEHLQEDWEQLRADVRSRLGLALGPLRVANRSEALPRLDSTLRRKLEARYAADYALRERLLRERG